DKKPKVVLCLGVQTQHENLWKAGDKEKHTFSTWDDPDKGHDCRCYWLDDGENKEESTLLVVSHFLSRRALWQPERIDRLVREIRKIGQAAGLGEDWPVKPYRIPG
ncbi:MAG: hypothetical protein HUK26_07895, partial [Duodenibacillus sp.]|nr:hypothetical protein [Duodenibacillus sp.]